MLWLYLLGAVTALIIALRRVLRRQKPLDDELYSRRVAIEHVHSGIAWIRADGNVGTVNQAFSLTLRSLPKELTGQEWTLLFPHSERDRIREAYRQALLMGIANIDTCAERPDRSLARLSLRLVVVHDHKMRFVGHYCLTEDRTQLSVLQDKLKELSEAPAQEREAVTETRS
jgi:PAS domain-containing protein